MEFGVSRRDQDRRLFVAGPYRQLPAAVAGACAVSRLRTDSVTGATRCRKYSDVYLIVIKPRLDYYLLSGGGGGICRGKSPYAIHLSDDQRAWLESHARRYTSPYRDVVRARIVLYAAEGMAQRRDRGAARYAAPDREQVAETIRRRRPRWPRGTPAAGDPLAFSPTSWSPLRRWPVSSRMSMASRSPASASRTSAKKRCAEGWSRRSARRRCGAG